MKRAIFAAFVLLLVSCAGNPEKSKIEAYLDALHPQFAPHKVTEAVRRDSASNPRKALELSADFYAERKVDLERFLKDMADAKNAGATNRYYIVGLAALDYVTTADLYGPMKWPLAAIDAAFTTDPKDCIGVECSYKRKGADPGKCVFYFEDGEVTFSDVELLDRLGDVYDAEAEVSALVDKILGSK